MKKHGYFVLAAAVAALGATELPAHAQSLPMPGLQLGAPKEISPEEKAKMDANARAAKAAQDSIPTPKASNDPWATVRSSNETPSRSRKSGSIR